MNESIFLREKLREFEKALNEKTKELKSYKNEVQGIKIELEIIVQKMPTIKQRTILKQKLSEL